MPRYVRPSWVRLKVDGRRSSIATGPRARSGCLSAEFLARVDGSPVPMLSVALLASTDGSSVRIVVRDLRTGRTIYEQAVPQ